MGKIAVIDTETNWVDQVMSIGTVLADSETFRPLDARYYLFPAECQIGGMYEKALYLPPGSFHFPSPGKSHGRHRPVAAQAEGAGHLRL